MVDKPKQRFFLALDQKTPDEARTASRIAFQTLADSFPSLGLGKHWSDNERGNDVVGTKVNLDQVHGPVQPWMRSLQNVFVDEKIAHGKGTGKKTLEKLKELIPDVRYYTVCVPNLGTAILREYVESARELGLETIAFTVHTNVDPEEVKRIYRVDNVQDAILHLGGIAQDAGCDSLVLEAEALSNPAIRALKLKKLVTGIRIDPEDKGLQSRVTSLDQLLHVLDDVEQIVVSSRYMEKPDALRYYFSKILRCEPVMVAPAAQPA